MFAKRHLLTVIAVLLMGLLLFAQPVPQTVAQEEVPGPDTGSASGSITFTAGDPALAPVLIPGGPGFFAQNGLGFQPYPSGTTPIAFSGRAVYNPDTVSHYYQAQVSLPHGAVITKFVIWTYENDATNDMWATLAKMGQDDSFVQQVAYISSSGANAAIRSFEDITMVSPEVDLQSYAYWVEIGMPATSSVRLNAFRIDYDFPTYTPVIQRP